LFKLAVYSPGLAGIFLVWWIFLVVCVPAAFYLGAAIKGPIIDPFPFSPWYAVIPALATGLVNRAC
jgi:hypothetical protein